MTNENAPIVVPLDGSTLSQNALPFAARLAAAYGDAPVHLLHVVDEDIVKTPEDLDKARDAFSSFALGLASEHGIKNPHVHVAQGNPADAVLRYKWEHAARFVVLATHGRGGFHAAFIGSVADKICRASRVPVLAVPGTETPSAPGSGPTLIAIDGSEEAEAALALGREVARLFGSDIHLLRAYSIPPPIGVEFSYYSPEVLQSFETAATEYLQQVAQPGEKTHIVQAQAAIAIEEAANQLDVGLVVLASKGRGLAHRLALGSTTDRVLHAVHRPILIVPSASND